MEYAAKDLKAFKNLVDKAKHIVILQPERIDPDSVGSALALTQLLADQKKKVTNFAIKQLHSAYGHFPNSNVFTTKLPSKFDLTILVDCGSPKQLQETFRDYLDEFAKRPFSIIDHHASREPMPFKALELIDKTAASSGQQVAELAEYFDWQLTPESAYSVAASIKSDTLDLGVSTVTPRTLSVLGNLVKLGANLEDLRINIEQAESMSPDVIPLKAKVLGRSTFHNRKRIAITYLNFDEYRHLPQGSMLEESVKHELRKLNGVQASAFISERQPNYYKVSIRANVPVAGPVASKFGGGGHDKAAGFFVNAKNAEEVVTKTAKALESEMKKL